MYSIIVSPQAKKELKLIAKIYKKALGEAISDLGQNPYLGKPLTRELIGRYSYKVGVYRIIYRINKKDKKVNIITVGHRGIIYK